MSDIIEQFEKQEKIMNLMAYYKQQLQQAAYIFDIEIKSMTITEAFDKVGGNVTIGLEREVLNIATSRREAKYFAYDMMLNKFNLTQP